MLATPAELEHVYRDRTQVIIGWVLVVLFDSMMIVRFAQELEQGIISILFALAILIVTLYVYTGLIRPTVYTSRAGIRVVNPVRSFELDWEEIGSFSIGRWTIFPSVCLIHTIDGRKLHAAAVNESTGGTDGKGVRMMEELNQELWRRKGQPSRPQPEH